MLVPQAEIQPPSVKQVAGGYLEGAETQEGFVLSRICSTDPALYLKKGMSPGSVYKG